MRDRRRPVDPRQPHGDRCIHESATGHRRIRCTRLIRVRGIRPAADTDAAQWLLRADVDWSDLVCYGPPGFDVYVRIAFSHCADHLTGDSPVDTVRAALAILAALTTTPSQGYAAIWEGWVSPPPPAPQAPLVEIPHRGMLLFTGPVEALRDAPALAWYGPDGARDHRIPLEDLGPPPHLVWPEDKAWCLACEVDEEIEFTVGCSEAAARALARALAGAVRRMRYGEPAPLYPRPGLAPVVEPGQVHADPQGSERPRTHSGRYSWTRSRSQSLPAMSKRSRPSGPSSVPDIKITACSFAGKMDAHRIPTQSRADSASW